MGQVSGCRQSKSNFPTDGVFRSTRSFQFSRSGGTLGATGSLVWYGQRPGKVCKAKAKGDAGGRCPNSLMRDR